METQTDFAFFGSSFVKKPITMTTLRECLLSSIAQYDAAPSIADRKEAAVVVVERARMYLAAEDQTPRKLKRLSDLEDQDTYSNPNTSTKLQVHITGRRPFTYLGVDYPTVQHAFQAQKFADDDDRERIARDPHADGGRRRGPPRQH